MYLLYEYLPIISVVWKFLTTIMIIYELGVRTSIIMIDIISSLLDLRDFLNSMATCFYSQPNKEQYNKK